MHDLEIHLNRILEGVMSFQIPYNENNTYNITMDQTFVQKIEIMPVFGFGGVDYLMDKEYLDSHNGAIYNLKLNSPSMMSITFVESADAQFWIGIDGV